MTESQNIWKRITSDDESKPSPRWGHTTILIPNSKKLFCFGGWDGVTMQQDTYFFDLEKNLWYQETVNGEIPSPRAGHSCTLLEKTSTVLLFGGGEGSIYFNDIHFFDLNKNKWYKPNITSKVKVYISEDLKVGEHTIHKILATDDTDQLIIDEELIGSLDETQEVTEEKSISSRYIYPAPRSRHACVLKDNKLILFGGGGSYKIYDDLWTLDCNTLIWDKPKTTGEKPSARWGHTMTLDDTKSYIFGGGGAQQNKMLNDLFELDMTTLTWKKIELSTNYPLPSPRASHSANFLAPNYLLIIFGGDNVRFLGELFVIALDKNISKRIKFKSPPPRCAHTSCLYEDNLYIFGGADDKGIGFDDLHILDTKLCLKKFGMERNEISLDGPLSQPLSQQAIIETEATVEKDPIRKSNSFSKRSKRFSKESQGFTEKDAREVTNWLVELGLGRFASHFINEEIDLQSVPLLKDEDLQKLGFSKFGPRKKIIVAAEDLSRRYHIPQPPPLPSQEDLHREPGKKRNGSQDHHIIDAISNLTKSVDSLKDIVKDLTISLQMMTSSQFIPQQSTFDDSEGSLPNSMKHQIHPDKKKKKSSKSKGPDIQGKSWFNEMEDEK